MRTLPYLLVLSCCCLLQTGSAAQPRSMAVITPDLPQILALSGSSLSVNCTIKRAPFNASSLYFQLKDTVIDKRHVQVLDNRTAQLVLPNMQRYQSGFHLYCLSHLYNESLAQQVVIVGDKPVQPNITSCQVYNWKNMTCWWEPKEQDTGIKNTTTTLYWAVSSGNANEECKASVNNHGHCQFSYRHALDTLPFHIWVHAVNMLAEDPPEQLTSETASWKGAPYMFVKPAAVKKFTSHIPDQRWMYLEWRSPAPTTFRLVQFELNYTDLWKLSSQQVIVNSSAQSFMVNATLRHLIPNAEYNLQLRGIPIVDNKTVGYYSDFFNTTIKTLPDVPGAAPQVRAELFQHDLHDDESRKGRHDVRIFWKTPPKHTFHDDQIYYRIKYCEQGASSWIMANASHDSMYYDLQHLKMDTRYDIQVEMLNGIGHNPTLQLNNITVPREKNLLKHPAYIVGQGNHTKVSLQWDAVDLATGYTVYWCYRSLTKRLCEHGLNWKTLNSSHDNRWEWELADNYNSYRLAVAAHNQDTSSGLLWLECIHDVSAELHPPLLEELMEHQPASGLILRWKPPKCQTSAYVYAYQILYCKNSVGCTKPEHWEKISVPGNNITCTLKSLESWQTYQVKIRSVGLKGQVSPSSSVITTEVKGTGLRKGEMVGVIIGCTLVLFLVIAGLITIIRICKKKMSRYGHMPIAKPKRLDITNNEYIQPDADGVAVIDSNVDRVTFYSESYGTTATQENDKKEKSTDCDSA